MAPTPERPTPDPWLRAAPPALLEEVTRPWAPPRGARILVAVSGGADSLALLHLLAALAPGRGWTLAAATLDHGLRGEASAADRCFVEEVCRRLDVPCRGRRLQTRPRRGESLELCARRVRHDFLRRTAATEKAEVIALGHQLEDQVETVLYRLARGTSLAGAGAMTRWAPPLWRPLLRVSRNTLREWLREQGAGWREDASNAELDAARNRIRHLVLPALTRALGGQALAGIARSASLAREEGEALHALAARLAPSPLPAPPGCLALDRRRLADLPPALRRLVLRDHLQRLGGSDLRLSRAHLEAVDALVEARGRGRRVDLPRGLVARREKGVIMLASSIEEKGIDG
ncbi:MAG: tRNA lysidine(34) synthetase TilS [Acidobacteriota bacterium]|nr:tRNA lysidine(34) synthetase TilS [Acidobacteriota bacterium]